jgi:hypothetical protein
MVCLNKQLCNALLIGLLSCMPLTVIAQDLSASALCPIKEFQSKQGAVRVWQQQFKDGVFDLVMSPLVNAGFTPVIRLSFAGSKEAKCHFPELSVLKGGEWGWHVAWASSAKQGVYYARVDGEAWVSSLPKKITPQLAEQVLLSEESGQLILSYQLLNQSKLQVLISDDEGRNFINSDEK